MASFDDAVAPPGTRPKDHQSPTPLNLFGGRAGDPVADSPDLQRVLALPRRPVVEIPSPKSEALIIHEMAKWGRTDRGPGECKCRAIDPQRFEGGVDGCISRLLPIQAWMLYEIGLVRGLLASCPVGGGKTSVGILGCLALGIDTLLLAPAGLVGQVEIEYQLLREHFRVPHLIVHTGKKKSTRWDSDWAGVPTLRVMSYNVLSDPDFAVELNQYAPAAIFADECDSLKSLDATRTRRVLRYMVEHPETRFCGWTGSLTDKSIGEFRHLAAWALREGSPLPLDPEVGFAWGACLDAVPWPSPPGALLELCEPGEDARHAFRRRLSETRGFVVTTDSRVIVAGGTEEVQLRVSERVAPEIPQNVADILETIRKGVRPDSLFGARGDEILSDPMVQAATAQHAAAGIIYYWEFPPDERDDYARIDEWFDARKEYNSEQREVLEEGREYLDSPILCERAARRAWGDDPPDVDRPSWPSVTWPRWRDVRDTVHPIPTAGRINDYLVRDSIEWALEGVGIVWYAMDEFARWMNELEPSLPVYGGGKKMAKALRTELGRRSIIASIASHGRGRNGLQFIFHRNLLANMMSSDTRHQQLQGRTHRRGQRSLVVETELYLHTPELRKSYDQAVRRGEYVQGILGEPRKLLIGLENAGQYRREENPGAVGSEDDTALAR